MSGEEDQCMGVRLIVDVQIETLNGYLANVSSTCSHHRRREVYITQQMPPRIGCCYYVYGAIMHTT